jgi:hypothetical protein
MKKNLIVLFAQSLMMLGLSQSVDAQDTTHTFHPSGKVWGYAFGDYYYKAHSDSLNRGGSNQYTGVPQSRSAFQFRRIYLGYNYDIAPKFSAEFLLAAEDDISGGDLLSNGKFAPYIKLADIQWKNIFRGTDLVVGQQSTPTFALLEEPIWGYRSIERTITDIRRTPSYDFGASLRGKFDPSKGNFGYDVMVGNGSGAKIETDNFKWFYGDVWAKALNKKLVFDLYADYERLNWVPGFHHSRNMTKAFVAYTTPTLTIGTEAYVNYLQKDALGTLLNSKTVDTTNAMAEGISIFITGTILKGQLSFFARTDFYNPDTRYDKTTYSVYKSLTSNYDANNREQFITAGLDFTPVKNVHFMPNIWYNSYTNQGAVSERDYDLVYRLTFYYVYGK